MVRLFSFDGAGPFASHVRFIALHRRPLSDYVESELIQGISDMRPAALLAGLVLGLCALLFGGGPSQAAPVDGGNALVEVLAEGTVNAREDGSIQAVLDMELADGWHVYWRSAGDSGLPPQLVPDDTESVVWSAFDWPIPHLQPLEGLTNYGFEERLALPFRIAPAEAGQPLPDTLTGKVDYLICLDICIPETASFRIDLTPQIAEPDRFADAMAWATARLPNDLQGEARISRVETDWRLTIADEAVRAAFEAELTSVRFFPYDHQILHTADQPAEIGPDGISLALTPDPDLGGSGTLSGVLAIEDISGERIGFALDAEPGEPLAATGGESFGPVSSETLSQGGSASLGFTAILGFLGLAFLGGLILNLMPCVLPILTIKATGLVETAASGDAARLRRHGLLYMAGVMVSFALIAVALIVLRALGEQAGLGFQLQYPPVVAGLALLLFVIGLNMLGVFEFGSSLMGAGSGLASRSGGTGAFFTGVLAAVVGAPCVGPFLGAALGVVVTQPAILVLAVFLTIGFGLALPFAAISFVPGLARSLPKPGAWMERLRQVFAFPLFLTAIWLLSVLADQIGTGALIITLVGASLIAFAIWLFRAMPSRDGPMRAGATLFGVCLLGVGIVLPVMTSASGTAREAATEVGGALAYGEDAIIEPWSSARVAELTEEGRPVFVDFTASWCVTCQVNKRTTLQRESVMAAFRENDVAFLVADWTNRDEEIAAELARHDRAGVPLYLWYPAGETIPEILPQILSPGLMLDIVSRQTSAET